MPSIISSLGRTLTDPYNIAAGVGTVASGGGLAAMLPLLGRAGLGAGVDYMQQGRQEEFNKRQREAQARANLMQAVSPRGQQFEAPVDVPKAGVLEKLGTAAQTGLSVADTYRAAKQAAQLRDLQLRNAEFEAGTNIGIEDALSRARAQESVTAPGPDVSALTDPWREGGTEGTAFQMPATEVSAPRATPEELGPGRAFGQFKGQELMRQSEADQAKALLPFLKFAQEQGQAQTFADAVNDNPEFMKRVPPGMLGRVLPLLTPGAIEEASGRKMSERGLGALTQSQAVQEKVERLQDMFKEATTRDLIGPFDSLSRFIDSKTLLGEFLHWPTESTAFEQLADDELLTQIQVTAESLIPTLRKATSETGVMTQKDEERIRGQLPSITGINDTAQLSKLAPLLISIQDVMSRHIQALDASQFLISPVAVPFTLDELQRESNRRR